MNNTQNSEDAAARCRALYLDLLKRQLVGLIYEDAPYPGPPRANQPPPQFDRQQRELGRDYPSKAHSMIGLRRMDNIQWCVEQILAEDVPGDLIETGVWRGGATILMRGLLAAYGVTDRTVWVADSFAGLPQPDLARFPQDAGWQRSATQLAISEEEVRANFARYTLLDDQVRFVVGWFSESLPRAPIAQLALLRLDGDLYGSTWDALAALYAKVTPGGFVIIDDYHFITCRQAVDDFRAQHQITAPLHDIDGSAVFWRHPPL
jgi:O-methyltransferase